MWHFLQGYVIIQIEGLYASRFLKRMTASGIRVWNIRQNGSACIRLSIPVKSVFSLHKLRKGLPVRIRILSGHGFPFMLKKLGKRPVLWIGSLAAFFAITALSMRIWIIRIEETDLIDPKEIMDRLAEEGIHPGSYLEGPILITAANNLSAQVHDAAWIGLDREGVMLKVDIVESLPESTKHTDRIPSDIVAEKDGVITKIEVMRGQARVKVGDRVKMGDVLISGTILYQDSSYETSADGTVKAVVLYRAEAVLSDTVTESYETDSSESVRVLCVAGWEILRTVPSFEHYRLTDPKTIRVSSLLPVTIETYTAKEICFRERVLSEEESEQNALVLAREQAYADVPQDAAIIHTYGTVRIENGQRIAVVTVTAEEIIGRTEEVPHGG